MNQFFNTWNPAPLVSFFLHAAILVALISFGKDAVLITPELPTMKTVMFNVELAQTTAVASPQKIRQTTEKPRPVKAEKQSVRTKKEPAIKPVVKESAAVTDHPIPTLSEPINSKRPRVQVFRVA